MDDRWYKNPFRWRHVSSRRAACCLRIHYDSAKTNISTKVCAGSPDRCAFAPCLATRSVGVCQSFSLPSVVVSARLGVVAAQRERRAVGVLGEPNMAGVHDNSGLAISARARSCFELVGAQFVVAMVA